MTKTNEVGFIGGMENKVISRFEYGYKYGVNQANKDANVTSSICRNILQMRLKVNL